MDKMFAVAGISTLEGDTKVRFAKDLARVKVLEKNGHKDIKLVDLPKQMTKVDAVAYLLTHAQFKDAASQAVLNAYGNDKPAKITKDVDASKLVKKLGDMSGADSSKKTPEEIEAIKAKNLQTIKDVHAKMKAEGKIAG